MAHYEHCFITQHRKPFFIVLMAAFVGLWFFTNPFWLVSETAKEIMEPMGTLFLFAGVLGRVFSTITIGGRKNQELVTTEIYSAVRHPLYFFSFLLIIGIGLLTHRPDLLVYLATAYLAIFIPIMRNEEKYLATAFGEKYADYAKATPAFFPNFRLYKARERMETNPQLIGRTFLDASLVLAFIPLMEVIEIVKKLMITE